MAGGKLTVFFTKHGVHKYLHDQARSTFPSFYLRGVVFLCILLSHGHRCACGTFETRRRPTPSLRWIPSAKVRLAQCFCVGCGTSRPGLVAGCPMKEFVQRSTMNHCRRLVCVFYNRSHVSWCGRSFVQHLPCSIVKCNYIFLVDVGVWLPAMPSEKHSNSWLAPGSL